MLPITNAQEINSTISISEENITNAFLLSNVSLDNFNTSTETNISEDQVIPNINEGVYYELENSELNNSELNESEEEEELVQVPLPGEIVVITDNDTMMSGFYVELGDNNFTKTTEVNDFEIEFSEPEQNKIVAGLPILIYQEVKIVNNQEDSIFTDINLWNYVEEMLTNSVSVKIMTKDAELISEEPIIFTQLEAFESKELIIVYEFPPIEKDIFCTTKTLGDILPKDAKIINAELSLDSIIESTCTIKIYYKGTTQNFDIDVNLDELDKETIKSIFFVEQNTYLNLIDGKITIPKLNELNNLIEIPSIPEIIELNQTMIQNNQTINASNEN